VQIRPEQLSGHLEGPLAPVYLICGGEPLLVQEACDELIAAANGQGYSERQIMHVETSFSWAELRDSTANMSLFAERRLLDLRLTPKQFDRAASDALRAYLEAPAEDVLLLVRTERLDSKQRNTAWFKAFLKSAGVVQVWPVGVAEMPRWLARRCERAGIILDQDALMFFSERMEGNLLAAVQEIEKLKLLDLAQPVSLGALQDAVLDSSHYDAFDLTDAALAGQPGRVRHIIAVLRQEGIQPLAAHGAFVSQLRQLIEGPRRGLPQQRERLLREAGRRLGPRDLEQLLIDSALVDQCVKGLRQGDPWRTLESLLLRLAGVRLHLAEVG
jgi:DNA polymerase-3 subunit delta